MADVRNRLTSAQKAKLLEVINDYKCAELAKQFNCTISTIAYYKRKYNKIVSMRWDDKSKKRLLVLIQLGKSTRYISDFFNVSAGAIQQTITRMRSEGYNIQRRRRRA